MGAGQREQHFYQDAAEIYFAFVVQSELERLGRNITFSASVLEKQFHDYLNERKLTFDGFKKQAYYKNIDSNYRKWLDETFPEKRMDIKLVEVEGRSKSMKRDITLVFDDGTPTKGIGLKNYEKGIRGNIQMCSGTAVSFLNNIFFDKAPGPGRSIDPISNKIFSPGRSKKKRKEAYAYLGLQKVSDLVDSLEKEKDIVRAIFKDGQDTKYWFQNNTAQKWDNKCKEFGKRSSNSVCDLLSNLHDDHKNKVKERLIVMTGLDGKDELLLFGPKEYLCSIQSQKFKQLVSDVNCDETKIVLETNGQSLEVSFQKEKNILLKIKIPFTLQKNGAWYIPDEPYEGSRRHPKEKIELVYGERRPKKCKEINTSINTYYSLVECGVI